MVPVEAGLEQRLHGRDQLVVALGEAISIATVTMSK